MDKGFEQTTFDAKWYLLKDKNGDLRGMVNVYVDDLAAAGDENFWKKMESLSFYFGTREQKDYDYLGNSFEVSSKEIC